MPADRDTRVSADKAKKTPQERAAGLIAGRKTPKRETRTPLFAMAVIFVVVLALLFFMISRRKPAGRTTGLKTRSETREAARRSRKLEGSAKLRQAPKPALPRSSLSEAAEPKRQRERALASEGRRTERRSSADKASRRSSRRSGAGRTLIVNGIAEGTALIGSRVVRSGDVIRGRTVREISGDVVRIEYGGVSYSLRVGDALP